MATKTFLIIAIILSNICVFAQSEDMKIAMMLKGHTEARLFYNKIYELTMSSNLENRQSNIDSALVCALKLTELLPDAYLGYQETAVLLNSIGKQEEACPYFRKAFLLGDTLSGWYMDDVCKNQVDPDIKIAFEFIVKQDYESALSAYRLIKEKDSTDFFVTEYHLNRAGYDILIGKKYVNDSKEESFKIGLVLFRVIVELYPYSSNAYDSLGEAYFLNNDKPNALINYKKSLEMNSRNENAKQYIEQLSH